MPFVSITRLRVRSWQYLPAFVIQSFRSARQAKAAAGNLSVGLLRDRHHAFWTRTLWTDEAAMRAFMRAGAHGHIMPRLLEWCDEAAVVHWMDDAPEPPSWALAHQRLQRDGRPSKVQNPSAAQERFEIPAPDAASD